MWQIEALEAALAEQHRAWGAKEARHKLTVERLRRQVVELQVCALPYLLWHFHSTMLTSSIASSTMAAMCAWQIGSVFGIHQASYSLFTAVQSRLPCTA